MKNWKEYTIVALTLALYTVPPGTCLGTLFFSGPVAFALFLKRNKGVSLYWPLFIAANTALALIVTWQSIIRNGQFSLFISRTNLGINFGIGIAAIIISFVLRDWYLKNHRGNHEASE